MVAQSFLTRIGYKQSEWSVLELASGLRRNDSYLGREKHMRLIIAFCVTFLFGLPSARAQDVAAF